MLKIFESFRSKRNESAEALRLLERFAGVGLWDAVLHDGDPMHPLSRWHWSAEFRRLLGFSDETDFPDAATSWAQCLHPDDMAPTMAAFGACLTDATGRTAYDVAYRLRTKVGEYRWFRAVGGVARDHAGWPLRACGSLIDIHHERMAEAAKREAMEALSSGFKTSVVGVLGGVLDTVRDMRGSAGQVLGTAHEARGLTISVSAAAEQATVNVQSIARAAEQLSDSITDIGRQVARATEISASATAEAAHTDARIGALSAAADRIGAVVNLINVIASQTNLLALNATIEAARAGDAGKGFAVVAGEVKDLASQTARATEEIEGQIASIQTETREAVDAIRHVIAIIGQVREISDVIAAGVERQGMATHAITRDVRAAAQGTDAIRDNLGAVLAAVRRTESDAEASGAAADALDSSSRHLESELDRFLSDIARA